MDQPKEKMRQIKVFWGGQQVGTLSCDQTEKLSFSYTDEWRLQRGPAISLSMPIAEQTYHQEAHNFFANLLPEGDYRRKIERLFQTSIDNDYILLELIGGECAGALTIAHEVPDEEASFYERLSHQRLIEIIESEGLLGLKTTNQIERLSLAGAQGKIPLYKEDREFYLPQKGAPSTHILKFNRTSHGYPRLVENEFFMTQIARHLGMDVISCQLQKFDKHFVFVSERYDRVIANTRWPIKKHQEDLCQALAYPHHRKYEKEGGPSFSDCTQLVKTKLGIIPYNRLIEWFFFNLILGNSDAHAKNISLIYENSGEFRLAPFYDLVCTRAYKNLDTGLAMAFGGEFQPDQVRSHHLKIFADELQVTHRFVRQSVKSLLERIPEAMTKAKSDLIDQGCELHLLQHVITMVERLYRSARKKFMN